MKKLVLALAVVLTAGLSASAFVDNQYMTTPQYMVNTGYSAEMSRMAAIVNQDPYREPQTQQRGFKNFMKKTSNYIIPGTYTDMDFYNHNITLNNPSWRDF